MKLSKKSLLYQSLDKFYSHVPNNVCDLFWSFMAMLVIYMGSIIVGFSILAFLTAPVWTLLFSSNQFDNNKLNMISGVLWGFIAIMTTLNSRLFIEFFKAKRDKYCVKIEFTE